jgi:hypothetical protein
MERLAEAAAVAVAGAATVVALGLAVAATTTGPPDGTALDDTVLLTPVPMLAGAIGFTAAVLAMGLELDVVDAPFNFERGTALLTSTCVNSILALKGTKTWKTHHFAVDNMLLFLTHQLCASF